MQNTNIANMSFWKIWFCFNIFIFIIKRICLLPQIYKHDCVCHNIRVVYDEL